MKLVVYLVIDGWFGTGVISKRDDGALNLEIARWIGQLEDIFRGERGVEPLALPLIICDSAESGLVGFHDRSDWIEVEIAEIDWLDALRVAPADNGCRAPQDLAVADLKFLGSGIDLPALSRKNEHSGFRLTIYAYSADENRESGFASAFDTLVNGNAKGVDNGHRNITPQECAEEFGRAFASSRESDHDDSDIEPIGFIV